MRGIGGGICFTVALALAIAVPACGSDAVEPGPAPSGGAGGVGSGGTTGGTHPEGGQGDLGGGGDGGSAGSGPSAHVTVSAYGWSLEPAPGMTVVANDSSGAVVETAMTAADGTAVVDVPVGGLVAMYPPEEDHDRYMQAILDPPDGSTVWFFSYADSPPLPQETQYSVTATDYPPDTATLAVLTCYTRTTAQPSSPDTTTIVADDDNCFSLTGQNTVLVIAYDVAEQPLSWGRADVYANPGGVVPVAVAVDQPSFVSFTDTITPIPDTATRAGILLSTSGDHPPFFQLIDGISAPGPSVAWSIDFPDTPMPFQIWEIVSLNDVLGYWYAGRNRAYDALPSATTFDPTIMARVYVDPLDTSDPEHPELSWSLGPGDPGDALELSITAQFETSGMLNFTILTPAGFDTTFRLPEIPDSVPYFALDEPPYAWHAAVGCLDEEGVTTWEGLYFFQGLVTGPISFITSSAGAPE